MENEAIQEEKKSTKPTWVKMKKEDLEKIVVDLAKQGEKPAKIGLILRDKHGIPKAKNISNKVTKILKDKKISYKTEKQIMNEKIAVLKKHAEKNKYDYPASRALTKKLWVAHKLEKLA